MVLFQIYTTNQLVSQRQTIFDILLMTAMEILSNHSRSARLYGQDEIQVCLQYLYC